MRMDRREARTAFGNFSYALVATTILIALFGAFVMAQANKSRDCSWRNQSGHSASQVSGVDWRCADSNYTNTGQ